MANETRTIVAGGLELTLKETDAKLFGPRRTHGYSGQFFFPNFFAAHIWVPAEGDLGLHTAHEPPRRVVDTSPPRSDPRIVRVFGSSSHLKSKVSASSAAPIRKFGPIKVSLYSPTKAGRPYGIGPVGLVAMGIEEKLYYKPWDCLRVTEAELGKVLGILQEQVSPHTNRHFEMKSLFISKWGMQPIGFPAYEPEPTRNKFGIVRPLGTPKAE